MVLAAPDLSPPSSTEGRLLSSTLAAYSSQLGRTLIRLVAEVALARLLLPAEHGLFDRALAVVVLIAAVRDLGLLYQVVRDPRHPFGAILVWSLSAGSLLAVGLVLAAPLLAPLDDELPRVVQVLAPYLLLDALAALPRVYFERRLEVRVLVAPEILRGALWASVAITLAFQGFGVWSFVAAELAAQGLVALLLWRRAWGRIPLTFDLKLLPELIRRSVLLFFIYLSALSLPLVGRFILQDNAVVGQYGKAHLWALRLQALLVPTLVRVFYPALVEYRGDRRRFIEVYRLGTLAILALECLAAYFLFFNTEQVVRLLLGEAWLPTVPLLRILAWLPLLDPFTRLGGEVLKARSEDRAWLVIVVVNLGSLVVFGLLFTHLWGPPGMAWAHYLLLGNLLMIWKMYHVCGPRLLRLAGELVVVYLLPLPFFATVAWVWPAESWSRFGASLGAAAAGGLVLGLWLQGPLRAFFVPRHQDA